MVSCTTCRQLCTALAIFALTSPACADYDSTTLTSVVSRIDAILEMPNLHSTLIQDGFRSGFFLDNRTGVQWTSVGSLMFAQIRTISTSFYHLWAGFENGAFLGYYQKDTLSAGMYSITWQPDENHSCSYNYTNNAWDKALDVPASGLDAVPNPHNDENDSGTKFLPARCREAFTAQPSSGVRAQSIDGNPFDCRYRGWYFATKQNTKSIASKRWTGMYIDRSTNNPAFALCAPLTNLTSGVPRYYGNLQPDEQGLLGVTCTGLYIEAISKELLDLNPDMKTTGSFIVERSSGLLVAASTPNLGDYYSASSFARVAAAASPNDHIRFATSSLNNVLWPDSFTGVVWVSSSDAVSFPSLLEGDAYYISSSVDRAPGLTWDIVVIQKVSCNAGEYVDSERLICAQCASPSFSTGGAPKTCDSCVETNAEEKGYYFRSQTQSCEPCPAGATCRGLTWLPFPRQGNWVKPKNEGYLGKEHPKCNEPDNCPGTLKSQGKAAALTCFKSNKMFAVCNVTANEMVCREGSTGRLCGVCASGFYLSSGEGCLDCEGPAGGTLVFMYSMIAMALVFLYVFFRHYEWLREQIWWKAVTGKGRFKIILTTSQIVGSVQLSARVVWGEPFNSFGELLSLSQLEFAQILPLRCALNYSLYDQVLVATLVPIAIGLLLRAPCFGVYGHALARGECINLMLTVAFVVLPSTSLTLFKFFDCTEFPDDKAFVTSDLSIDCGSELYTGYFIYASFMLLIFPFGIPIAFFALLYPRRELISSRDPDAPLIGTLQKFRFLVEDYKPSHWHGEIFRSYMRVSLAGGVIVMSTSTAMRATYGCLLSFAFVVFLREYQPFEIPFNNALAVGAQYQILFTYIMAFFLVTEPIPISRGAVGAFLFAVNLFVFLSAFFQQLKEAQGQSRLKTLRAEVESFSASMINVVGVRRSIENQELVRFVYGDWSVLSPQQQRRASLRRAASANNLDMQGLESEDELSRFLAVTMAANESGFQAKWYWQEDDDRLLAHNRDSIFGNCWVEYAASVAAQLEFFHNEKGPSTTTIVDVDVSGRVTSAVQGNRGKAFHLESGTVYSVDLKRGVQINSKTKFERKVMRQMVPVGLDPDAGEEAKDEKKIDMPTSFKPRRGSSILAADDDHSQLKYNMEPKPFPADLAAAGEPILLMHPGMLVQIQKSREQDGWAYGVVVYGSEDAAMLVDQRGTTEGISGKAEINGANSRSISGYKGMKNKNSVSVNSTATSSTHSSSSQASSLDRVFGSTFRGTSLDRTPGSISQGTSVDRVFGEELKEEVADENVEDDDDQTTGSVSNGWFPLSFTGQPTVEEMHAFQDLLGGEGHAERALAPPPTWSPNSDPLTAHLFPVDQDSHEWGNVERVFKATLGDISTAKFKELCTVRRVENLPLWQSYNVKKNALVRRAQFEGLSSKNYERKDKNSMFHGSSPDMIPKICQHGFNQAFYRKQDAEYGKGVYFARSSRYSDTFGKKDSSGIMRVFLCRVLVGEVCQGHNGELVPAVRDSKKNLLFDTTTDHMDDNKRNVYITHQDYQAYPEYLIEYATAPKKRRRGSLAPPPTKTGKPAPERI